MKLRHLATALVVFGAWQGPAIAQGSIEDRLREMEQRIQLLERQVADQHRVIDEKNRQISSLAKKERGWFDSVRVRGKMEIDAIASNPSDGPSETDLEVGKVELGATAAVNDWTDAEIVLALDDDAVIVDTATVTMSPIDTPVEMTAGKYTVPFGVFKSNLITSPLTKKIGETVEHAAQFGVDAGGVTATGFVFEGGNDRSGKSRVENFGGSVGYSMKQDPVSIGITLSYINDIGETDRIEGKIEGDASDFDMVRGGAASLVAKLSGMTIIAEYLTAMDRFKADELEFEGKGAKPSAWTIETAYGFPVYGKDVTAAISYQGTDEAEALGQPESRFLVGFEVGLDKGLALAMEWLRDETYDGDNETTASAQLALKF